MAILFVKVGFDDGLDDAEGMIGSLVEVVPDLLEDVVGDVVVRVRGDDVCVWVDEVGERRVRRYLGCEGGRCGRAAMFRIRGSLFPVRRDWVRGAPSRLTTTGWGAETAARTTMERELWVATRARAGIARRPRLEAILSRDKGILRGERAADTWSGWTGEKGSVDWASRVARGGRYSPNGVGFASPDDSPEGRHRHRLCVRSRLCRRRVSVVARRGLLFASFLLIAKNAPTDRGWSDRSRGK